MANILYLTPILTIALSNKLPVDVFVLLSRRTELVVFS